MHLNSPHRVLHRTVPADCFRRRRILDGIQPLLAVVVIGRENQWAETPFLHPCIHSWSTRWRPGPPSSLCHLFDRHHHSLPLFWIPCVGILPSAMSIVHGSEPSGPGCLGRWRQLSQYLRLAIVAGCVLFALLIFQFSELLHVGNPVLMPSSSQRPHVSV
jgi:hypothetical protein